MIARRSQSKAGIERFVELADRVTSGVVNELGHHSPEASSRQLSCDHQPRHNECKEYGQEYVEQNLRDIEGVFRNSCKSKCHRHHSNHKEYRRPFEKPKHLPPKNSTFPLARLSYMNRPADLRAQPHPFLRRDGQWHPNRGARSAL